MKHFSLAISLRDWSFQIELPEKTFPQKFWVEKNNFVCGGYFVVWEKELGKEEIFELAINKKWKELATLVADFIISLWIKKVNSCLF